MPQANITYDTPYNRKLASRVNQLEEDMLWYNKHQYHPSPMGFRIGNFHNAQGIANTPNISRDYSYEGGGGNGKVVGGAGGSSIIGAVVFMSSTRDFLASAKGKSGSGGTYTSCSGMHL